MNALDVAIIIALAVAAYGGWKLGLVARAFAWAGVAAGLAVGVHFVPRVVTAFGGATADDRVTVALLFLALLATVGQAIGLGIGLVVHRRFPIAVPMPLWDRAAGMFVGVAGVLILLWMVIPSLATAQGWPARMARGSWIVGRVDALAPTQPAQFAAWGRAISDAPYPSALGPLDAPPNPGAPPGFALGTKADTAARASTVKVTGVACSQIQEGSGWIEAPGMVVTNAHVVAGERHTTVRDAQGNGHDARVVVFDPVRDLAVLSVPELAAPALAMADGSVGATGAVYGHPNGGPLVASPARVGEEIIAVGTDIYRTGSSRRHVYVLAARLAPGDSGGPLVDRQGAVIGVAFAIDPGERNTAYAITDSEVRAVLPKINPAGVGTGGCLVE